MQIGLVGLGKMGGNMRERLRAAGHTVVGYDTNPDLSDVASLADLVERLDAPRTASGSSTPVCPAACGACRTATP